MSVWLEGENPTIIDRILIYGGGMIGGLIVLLISLFDASVSLPIWGYIVFALVSFDIIGGVISNFTTSTTEFYKKQSLIMKLLFLSLHFIHPLALILVFNLDWWFMLIFPVMFLISSFIFVIPVDYRKPAISFLVTIAIILEYSFLTIPTILLWFIPAYLLKLSLSFTSKV